MPTVSTAERKVRQSMKSICLTKGMSTVVSDEDYDRLAVHKWCVSNGYAVRTLDGRRGLRRVIAMHAEIMSPPQGFEVDHINRDKLDNRRENLRLATRALNLRNKGVPKNSRSGYKGVFWNTRSGAWNAQISVSGKSVSLGLWDAAEHAALAYDRKASELFGEYAWLNFPESTESPSPEHRLNRRKGGAA